MPIKFRCKYCQQFLGIALSRAGAIVDCPQCGRSLQVPDPDGRARRASETASGADADSDFLAALSELSALGPPTEPQRPSVATAPRTSDTKRPAVSAAAATIVPVAIPSIDPAAAQVSIPTDAQDDLLQLREQDNPLLELAALGQSPSPSSAALSEDLLSEMRRVSHPSSPLLQIFGGMLLLLVGGACGWWLAKSGTLPFAARTNPAAASQASPDDTNSPVPPAGAQPAPADFADAISFSGSVTYTDATGTQRPDSGALVMLLPLQRAGTLKLDAQSLMRPAVHPDHKATLAALSQLGGDFAEADQTGRFTLRRTATPGDQLIVISRHLQRPADLAVTADVVAVLQNWFASSSRMTGRLRVQLLQPVTQSQQQDIVFRHAAGAQ